MKAEPTPEQNLQLLNKIEEGRAFLLLAYQSDPKLLKFADPQIKRLFDRENTHVHTKDARPSSDN